MIPWITLPGSRPDDHRSVTEGRVPIIRNSNVTPVIGYAKDCGMAVDAVEVPDDADLQQDGLDGTLGGTDLDDVAQQIDVLQRRREV